MEKTKLYTANQLADMFQVSRLTIAKWAGQGYFDAIKIGRSVRYMLTDELRLKLEGK